jgi:hypothetical protein
MNYSVFLECVLGKKRKKCGKSGKIFPLFPLVNIMGENS